MPNTRNKGVRIRNAYFRNGQHEPDTDNSHETTIKHNLAKDKTCTIPGNIQDGFSEIFPQTDEVGDGIHTDHYKKTNAETLSEQLSPTDANPRSTRYDLRHNPQPNYNDDYRYQFTSLFGHDTPNN